MKRVLSAAATVVTIIAALASLTSLAEQSKNQIVGLTRDEVRWFTPPTTPTADNERSCWAIPPGTVPGSIGRKYLPVPVSSRIRTRKTN